MPSPSCAVHAATDISPTSPWALPLPGVPVSKYRLPQWHDWWMCTVHHSGMIGGCVQSATLVLLVYVYRPPQSLDWWMCTVHHSGMIGGCVQAATVV